eukprot:1184443-Prorocentrum_minimum.AAC.9
MLHWQRKCPSHRLLRAGAEFKLLVSHGFPHVNRSGEIVVCEIQCTKYMRLVQIMVPDIVENHI